LQKAVNDGGLRKVHFSWRWASAALGGSLASALALTQAAGSLPATLTLAGGGALALSSLAYAAFVEARSPLLERLSLRFGRLPADLDGLRIMQISDIHLGTPHGRCNLEQALTITQRERPDLLLFTGDFVSKHEPIGELAALLRGVSAPLGCYAVLGNHDYWEGPQEIADQLALAGVELLVNEGRELLWKGARLFLAGVDELWGGHPNFEATLQGRPAGAFTLLMAHTPLMAEQAARHGVDLQLSGHTHGGHIHLPLLGPLALPHHGQRYERGLHRVGTTTVYTSRGLGGIPLRLNCPPEVTLLTLLKA
jgi:hypothetical protein